MTARTIILATLLTITIVGAISICSFKSVGNVAQARSEKKPAGPMRTYGIYWQVGGGYSSTLILRNKDVNNPVTANVVLYSHNGEIKLQTEFKVAANSVNRLSLEDIVKVKGGSEQWGGLMLDFQQPATPSVMGQVVVENYQKGINFDLPLQAGDVFDKNNALFAPWWFPDDGTDGTVTMFNQSTEAITVYPSIVVGDSDRAGDKINLAPKESKKLLLRQLLGKRAVENGKIGSITLRYSGQPHALLPALLLENKHTGFSLSPFFSAKHNQPATQQTIWRFPDVFVAPDKALGFDPKDKLTAYALLSNGTTAILQPKIEAHIGGLNQLPAQSITLPIDPLKAHETRLVNITKFIETGVIPAGIGHFSLDASHQGSPGDLGITVFSVGETKDFVFRSEGTIKASKKIYSSYWDIDDDLVALLSVENASSDVVGVNATLNFQTSHGSGTYILPRIDVGAHGSRILNLKQIILGKTPDANGNVIPTGTTFGTLTVNVLGGAKTDVVTGGTTSFDPVSGGYGLLLDPCGACQADDGPFCTPDGGSEDPFYGPGGGFGGCTPQCVLMGGCGGGGDGGDPGDGGSPAEPIPTTISTPHPVLIPNGQTGVLDVRLDQQGLSTPVRLRIQNGGQGVAKFADNNDVIFDIYGSARVRISGVQQSNGADDITISGTWNQTELNGSFGCTVVSLQLSAPGTHEVQKPTHYLNLTQPNTEAEVTASLTPGDADPAGIGWTGGQSASIYGDDNSQRAVDISTARDADVTASLLETNVGTVRIHAISAIPPPQSQSNPSITWFKSGPATNISGFGGTVTNIGPNGVPAPTYHFNPYFAYDHWVFRLTDVQHGYKQSVTLNGHIDLPVGNMVPFPRVLGMNLTDSHATARSDLDISYPPSVDGGPFRSKYCVLFITQIHENAHVDRFYSEQFWLKYMRQFQNQYVEGPNGSVIFDCNDSTTTSASAVSTRMRQNWDITIASLHANADTEECGFSPILQKCEAAELACHAVSNPYYVPIHDSIPNP